MTIKKLCRLVRRSVPTFGAAFCIILFFHTLQHCPTELTEDASSFNRFEDVHHQAKRLWSNSCGQPLSFLFVRTHKTGSTSLLTMLNSYIEKRWLKNQTKIDEVPGPFVGGYPGRFRRDFAFLNGSKSLSDGVKADFLRSHMRFNKDEVQAVMNPNAKYITIIRDPLKQFESAFNFYYYRFNGGLPSDPILSFKCPYLYLTKRKSISFSEYIHIADSALNESVPWFFRSRNLQSFDLGIDPLNMDDEYILLQAKKLDETFHLVVILEHIFESLVLLKDLLCMEWQDIARYEAKNQGRYKTHTYTVKEKDIVEKFTKQDRILYNYFNASLWRKIERYGYERMKKDVVTLQTLMAKRQNRVKNSLTKLTRRKLLTIEEKGLPLKTHDKQDATLKLTGMIKQQMNERKLGPRDENFEIRANKMAQYMTESFGQCPL